MVFSFSLTSYIDHKTCVRWDQSKCDYRVACWGDFVQQRITNILLCLRENYQNFSSPMYLIGPKLVLPLLQHRGHVLDLAASTFISAAAIHLTCNSYLLLGGVHFNNSRCTLGSSPPGINLIAAYIPAPELQLP